MRNGTALILLADDEEIFLEMASLKLRGAGYETVTARGALEAMQKLEEVMPDLLLSDIDMPPGPNGLELAVALRHDPKTEHLKIAFLSSMAEPWLVLPERKRAEAMASLKDAVFLNKENALESLDEHVARIISEGLR